MPPTLSMPAPCPLAKYLPPTHQFKDIHTQYDLVYLLRAALSFGSRFYAIIFAVLLLDVKCFIILAFCMRFEFFL